MMCERQTPKAEVELGTAVVAVDSCLAGLVTALNAAGYKTLACCCGHGERDGRIALDDGREINIRAFTPSQVLNWSDLVSAKEATRICTMKG